MRVYVPATLPLLATWTREGAVPAVAARAVTAALREWYVEGETEELEFSALLDAATDALVLLAEDPGAPRRRLVLAVDVPDSRVTARGGALDDEPPSAVDVGEGVPLSAVVSAHCDEHEAEAVVAAAVAALPAARAGDEDARLAVDAADDEDLLWFDASELADLAGSGAGA